MNTAKAIQLAHQHNLIVHGYEYKDNKVYSIYECQWREDDPVFCQRVQELLYQTVSVDLETSGLYHGQILSAAAVRENGDWYYFEYIPDDLYGEPGALDLNRELIKGKGQFCKYAEGQSRTEQPLRSLEAGLSQLYQWIENTCKFPTFMGSNPDFDLRWLRKHKYPETHRYTLDIATLYRQPEDYKSRGLAALAEEAGLSFEHHNALEDAQAVMDLYHLFRDSDSE